MRNFLHKQSMETFAAIMLAGLGVQFLFGIYTNLFVEFDQNVLGWITIHDNLPSSIHLYLGAALSVAAIFFLAAAAVQKSRCWLIASAAGLAGIMVAALCGVAFAGTQDDAYSFFMSAGFIGSMLAYAYGLFVSARSAKKN